MTDEPSNIVALRPGIVLPVEQMTNLREQGILTHKAEEIDSLDLSPVQAGDVILGTLTTDECELYVNYFESYAELDLLRRSIGGNFYQAMGDKVREGKEPDAKLIMDETVPEEIGKEVHRLWRKTELLKNLLYWQVGERFDVHEYILGVRTLRRVIRGARKY